MLPIKLAVDVLGHLSGLKVALVFRRERVHFSKERHARRIVERQAARSARPPCIMLSTTDGGSCQQWPACVHQGVALRMGEKPVAIENGRLGMQPNPAIVRQVSA